MHWDRKLTIFSVLALVLVLAAAVCLVLYTSRSLGDGGERVRGNADEGFRRFSERVKTPDSIAHVKITRRAKFESAEKYRDFDPLWLRELTPVPGEEFLEDDIEYTHTVELTLKTYDTEGVYTIHDNSLAYTKDYEDKATLFKNGDLYYVGYREGAAEYHFAVSCPPLTEWLNGITSARLD